MADASGELEERVYALGRVIACPICLSIMESPARLPCLHYFCWGCITHNVRPRGEVVCPVCRGKTNRREIQADAKMATISHLYGQLEAALGKPLLLSQLPALEELAPPPPAPPPQLLNSDPNPTAAAVAATTILPAEASGRPPSQRTRRRGAAAITATAGGGGGSNAPAASMPKPAAAALGAKGRRSSLRGASQPAAAAAAGGSGGTAEAAGAASSAPFVAAAAATAAARRGEPEGVAAPEGDDAATGAAACVLLEVTNTLVSAGQKAPQCSGRAAAAAASAAGTVVTKRRRLGLARACKAAAPDDDDDTEAAAHEEGTAAAAAPLTAVMAAVAMPVPDGPLSRTGVLAFTPKAAPPPPAAAAAAPPQPRLFTFLDPTGEDESPISRSTIMTVAAGGGGGGADGAHPPSVHGGGMKTMGLGYGDVSQGRTRAGSGGGGGGDLMSMRPDLWKLVLNSQDLTRHELQQQQQPSQQQQTPGQRPGRKTEVEEAVAREQEEEELGQSVSTAADVMAMDTDDGRPGCDTCAVGADATAAITGISGQLPPLQLQERPPSPPPPQPPQRQQQQQRGAPRGRGKPAGSRCGDDDVAANADPAADLPDSGGGGGPESRRGRSRRSACATKSRLRTASTFDTAAATTAIEVTAATRGKTQAAVVTTATAHTHTVESGDVAVAAAAVAAASGRGGSIVPAVMATSTLEAENGGGKGISEPSGAGGIVAGSGEQGAPFVLEAGSDGGSIKAPGTRDDGGATHASGEPSSTSPLPPRGMGFALAAAAAASVEALLGRANITPGGDNDGSGEGSGGGARSTCLPVHTGAVQVAMREAAAPAYRHAPVPLASGGCSDGGFGGSTPLAVATAPAAQAVAAAAGRDTPAPANLLPVLLGSCVVSPRDEAAAATPPAHESGGAATGGGRRVSSRLLPWSCPACTLENKAANKRCVMCRTAKPRAAPPEGSNVIAEQVSGGGDGNGGGQRRRTRGSVAGEAVSGGRSSSVAGAADAAAAAVAAVARFPPVPTPTAMAGSASPQIRRTVVMSDGGGDGDEGLLAHGPGTDELVIQGISKRRKSQHGQQEQQPSAGDGMPGTAGDLAAGAIPREPGADGSGGGGKAAAGPPPKRRRASAPAAATEAAAGTTEGGFQAAPAANVPRSARSAAAASRLQRCSGPTGQPAAAAAVTPLLPPPTALPADTDGGSRRRASTAIGGDGSGRKKPRLSSPSAASVAPCSTAAAVISPGVVAPCTAQGRRQRSDPAPTGVRWADGDGDGGGGSGSNNSGPQPHHRHQQQQPHAAAAATVANGSSSRWSQPCPSWVLLGSALDEGPSGKGLLKRLAAASGGRVVEQYNPAVTHVLCGTDASRRARRTFKYLMGVAHGAWLLDVGWAAACLSAGHAVPEDGEFAVVGDQNGGVCGAAEARRRRLHRHGQQQQVPQQAQQQKQELQQQQELARRRRRSSKSSARGFGAEPEPEAAPEGGGDAGGVVGLGSRAGQCGEEVEPMAVGYAATAATASADAAAVAAPGQMADKVANAEEKPLQLGPPQQQEQQQMGPEAGDRAAAAAAAAVAKGSIAAAALAAPGIDDAAGVYRGTANMRNELMESTQGEMAAVDCGLMLEGVRIHISAGGAVRDDVTALARALGASLLPRLPQPLAVAAATPAAVAAGNQTSKKGRARRAQDAKTQPHSPSPQQGMGGAAECPGEESCEAQQQEIGTGGGGGGVVATALAVPLPDPLLLVDPELATASGGAAARQFCAAAAAAAALGVPLVSYKWLMTCAGSYSTEPWFAYRVAR